MQCAQTGTGYLLCINSVHARGGAWGGRQPSVLPKHTHALSSLKVKNRSHVCEGRLVMLSVYQKLSN